jgi:hypothetical protein
MPSRFCDAHYSYECGCSEPEDRVVPSLPPFVWVVVEIYSKSVRLNDKAATNPIAGKAAIFAKPEITQQVAAKIVGVYQYKGDALKALPNREGAEYIVESLPVETAPPAPLPAAADVVPTCILCGVPSTTSFCQKCRAERNAIMRERDAAIITEMVPSA